MSRKELSEREQEKIIDSLWRTAGASAFAQEINKKDLASQIADRAADISSGYDPTRFENHSELIHAITLTAATEILSESYRSTIESCIALACSLGCLGPSMCGGGAHHDPRCPRVLSERLLGLLEGPVDASGGAAAGAVSAGAPEDLPEVPCALCGQRPVVLKTKRYGFICASCAELDQYLNEK